MSHIRVGTYVAWVQSQGSEEAAFSLQSLTLVGEEGPREEGREREWVQNHERGRGGRERDRGACEDEERKERDIYMYNLIE